MILLLLLFSVVTHCSQILSTESLALTIYNDGYGIIKDIRKISLDPSQSYLSVDEIAATIQSETVVLKHLQGNQTIKVLEQNFENNLIDKSALLKKYLNKEVVLFSTLNSDQITEIRGTLLAYSPSYLLQTSNGLEIFDEIYGIILSSLPDGLLLMPSLVWKVKSPFDTQTTTQCQIAYRATGFSWKADYNIIISNDQKTIDLTGWVTIDNGSGKRYKDAKIKLIAGQVNTVPKPVMFRRFRMAMAKGSVRSGRPSLPLITEKSFGDYHMYTISNRVSLNESSVKQIQFIPLIKDISIRKYYLITTSTGGYPEQDISSENMISFNNSKENKMGIPLPKGNVKILKQDSDDKLLQLLRQGNINHSPKNQLVKLSLGTNSFIVVKKIIKQKERRIDGGWNASVQLDITNTFTKAVEIQLVLKNSYGNNLEIEVAGDEIVFNNSSIYEKKTIVKIGAQEKKKIRWIQNYSSPL